MAITNPEAIRFCNEKVRVAADRLAQAYYFAKAVSQEWVANNLGTIITPTADVVRDSASPNDDLGTGGDGRHVITGSDATLIINRCDDLIADMEANTNAKLNTLLNVAVNPQ